MSDLYKTLSIDLNESDFTQIRNIVDDIIKDLESLKADKEARKEETNKLLFYTKSSKL